jgi:hypothetical protein
MTLSIHCRYRWSRRSNVISSIANSVRLTGPESRAAFANPSVTASATVDLVDIVAQTASQQIVAAAPSISLPPVRVSISLPPSGYRCLVAVGRSASIRQQRVESDAARGKSTGGPIAHCWRVAGDLVRLGIARAVDAERR